MCPRVCHVPTILRVLCALPVSSVRWSYGADAALVLPRGAGRSTPLPHTRPHADLIRSIPPSLCKVPRGRGPAQSRIPPPPIPLSASPRKSPQTVGGRMTESRSPGDQAVSLEGRCRTVPAQTCFPPPRACRPVTFLTTLRGVRRQTPFTVGSPGRVTDSFQVTSLVGAELGVEHARQWSCPRGHPPGAESSRRSPSCLQASVHSRQGPWGHEKATWRPACTGGHGALS